MLIGKKIAHKNKSEGNIVFAQMCVSAQTEDTKEASIETHWNVCDKKKF